MLRKHITASAAIVLALLFFVSLGSSALAQNPECGLLKDCDFNNFYGDSGACSADWKCGSPGGIGLFMGEGWRSAPSVNFTGNTPFDRFIWQTVPVTPGKGYQFSLPYAVVNIDGKGWHDGDQVDRRVGIDPFGGTDPSSPNITWSPDFYLKGKFQQDQLQVNEYAKAPNITVFIEVKSPYGDRHVDVFVDLPSLVENTGMAPINVAVATVTPPPPPPTIPPTAAPTVAAAKQPTDEPTVAPTDEPTAAPTEAATAAPTDAPTQVAEQATDVPPTRTRAASARPTRVAVVVTNSSDGGNDSLGSPDAVNTSSAVSLGIIGVVGIVGVLGAGLLVAAAAFLLLRRK